MTKTAELAEEGRRNYAETNGVPGAVVDGNDVRAVYEAAKEAVERARAGEGPTLIECKTYRCQGHSTSDSGLAYRSEEEIETWRKKDPVDRFRKVLLKEGILTEKEEERMRKDLEVEAEKAMEFALNAPIPEPEELFEDLFAPPYEADETTAREPFAEKTCLEAINEALREEMERHPNVFIMGEDIAVLEGKLSELPRACWSDSARSGCGIHLSLRTRSWDQVSKQP